jgi:hypothetical protein
MSMVVFDVPYEPATAEYWLVLKDAQPVAQVHSRVDAVKFAALAAADVEQRPYLSALLRIEGADGVWRLFDTGMKALVP